ncbi:hypothetical protein I3842_16G023900 [Carya illinoinensis]|uniref:FAD/NAD(P)-binding domain-containing protein n=1 Tax=Carya illinoinensis TaxID=32201 RepID=A0A921ZZN3_CARIL|nr:hypothetical protein I3842_16G023900 [Carya illinoinensis]
MESDLASTVAPHLVRRRNGVLAFQTVCFSSLNSWFSSSFLCLYAPMIGIRVVVLISSTVGRSLTWAIHSGEMPDRMLHRFGTQILTETVNKVDFSTTPFKIFADSKTVFTESVIVATSAVAKRLDFLGSAEGSGGFWNRGISACAVCDGAAPIFRNKPVAVIGGGDLAMEEATFLTKYGSIVYIIHRRDTFRASKIMQLRADAWAIKSGRRKIARRRTRPALSVVMEEPVFSRPIQSP